MGNFITDTLHRKILRYEDIYCVKPDHILFFEHMNNSKLQKLMFSSDVSSMYYEKLVQTVLDKHIISIDYYETIIHCVTINHYAYPSSKVTPTSFGWSLTKL
jgi:hypothetical protein